MSYISEDDFEAHVKHNCGDKKLASKLINISMSQGSIYRGIYYNINNLKIGGTYTHWYETVSWSKSFDVAKNFALKWSNVSEGIFETLYFERYDKWISWNEIDEEIFKSMEKEFVSIILIDKNGLGVYVNDYLKLEESFASEEEVVTVNKNWTITNIEFSKELDLYLVTVKGD